SPPPPPPFPYTTLFRSMLMAHGAPLPDVNLTTGVITGGDGDGLISLRSAVIAANGNAAATNTITLDTAIYTLTSHGADENLGLRSEEHTSELQSPYDLV